MSWHVGAELLETYARGELETPSAFGVEAHMTACASCRAEANALVRSERLERVWAAVSDAVDERRAPLLERALRKAGVADHMVRLLTATPALRASWLAAIAATLAFAVAATYVGDGTPLPFLAVAPLVPVGGIAAAYGPGIDPTYEIGVAAPMSGIRLLLVRVTAVLVATGILAGVAALLLPGVHAATAAWIAPSLALTAASLVLSTIVGPLTSAASVAGAWVTAVLVQGAGGSDAGALFSPRSQIVFVGIALLCATALVHRRDALERGAE